MRSNEIACYYESLEGVVDATFHVSIAYIEHLHRMTVALDIGAGEDRHTVYIQHARIPQIVQALSSSYFSITDTLKQMEEEYGK